MTGRYGVLSQRIRQELAEIDAVAVRVERVVTARQHLSVEGDLFLDAATLNVHDFYAGLERMFRRIATEIDSSSPTGSDWPRDLLHQMTTEIPGLRPAVISFETTQAFDDHLRFRHVVGFSGIGALLNALLPRIQLPALPLSTFQPSPGHAFRCRHRSALA
jgi:hypothetical protein